MQRNNLFLKFSFIFIVKSQWFLKIELVSCCKEYSKEKKVALYKLAHHTFSPRRENASCVHWERPQRLNSQASQSDPKSQFISPSKTLLTGPHLTLALFPSSFCTHGGRRALWGPAKNFSCCLEAPGTQLQKSSVIHVTFLPQGSRKTLP